MSVLAIVPARGGSRAVPRKNLLAVGGQQLVVRAVLTGLAARSIDRVVVSTDHDEIAAAALAAGGEVVMRPAELATDEAPTEAALLHVLDTLGGADPEYVVTLEPTSPLRTAATVDACVQLARGRGADAVITVAETRDVLGRLEGDRFVTSEPDQPRRRQLRSPLYREAGVAYVTRTAHLRRTKSVIGDPLYALVVSAEEAIDINRPLDLIVAEAALHQRGFGDS